MRQLMLKTFRARNVFLYTLRERFLKQILQFRIHL